MNAMTKALKDAGVHTGVAVLLLVGLEEKTDATHDGEKRSQLELKNATNTFTRDGIGTFEVVVGEKDEFGINEMVHASTHGGGEFTEIYTSHGDVPFFAASSQATPESLVRKRTKKSDESYILLKGLMDKMGTLALDGNSNKRRKIDRREAGGGSSCE